MLTSDLLQRIPAILIFSLTFAFLTSTVTASENNVGRIPFLISNEDEALASPQEGSATPKQDSPNWGSVPNLRYVEREDTDPAGTSGSLAEVYLARVAEWHKQARKKTGVFYLVGGTTLVALGIAVLVSDQDMENAGSIGATLIGGGLFFDGLAIWNLATPSHAQRELDNVLGIPDLAQRERIARKTLVSRAQNARTGRIFAAIPLAIMSLVSFTGESYGIFELQLWDYCMGALFGALAIHTLTTKSPEETALQQYLEESKQGQEMGLRLGIDPSGRVRVGLVLSF